MERIFSKLLRDSIMAFELARLLVDATVATADTVFDVAGFRYGNWLDDRSAADVAEVKGGR